MSPDFDHCSNAGVAERHHVVETTSNGTRGREKTVGTDSPQDLPNKVRTSARL
jgi:hypothetical protein